MFMKKVIERLMESDLVIVYDCSRKGGREEVIVDVCTYLYKYTNIYIHVVI